MANQKTKDAACMSVIRASKIMMVHGIIRMEQLWTFMPMYMRTVM